MPVTKKLALHPKPTPELDTPRYLLGDAAAAAGVSPGTLKAWLSRNPRVVTLGPHDQAGRGKGTPRLLTLRRVYAIAITAELVSLGFIASRAGVLAFLFTEVKIVGAELFEKYASFLEVKGDLSLAVRPSRNQSSLEQEFSVFTSQELFLGDLTSFGAPGSPRSVSCALIDCAALMRQVRARLKERGAA